MIQALISLFDRDLNRLKAEILAYEDDSKLWVTQAKISNSAGNLCLHLIGNLNTYIGATLGNTGYIRHRELEFSLKDIPRDELLRKIDETILVVTNTLRILSEDNLKMEYPLLVLKEKTSTEYFLIHLSTHLNYHLGQINYHRRLLSDVQN